MSEAPFTGQRTQMSREEALERYILLRLRFEDIKRLAYLVEGFYAGAIQLPAGEAFSAADIKDTVRTAFFGWFATLTDRDNRAVYAFDPLYVLFPHERPRIYNVQVSCEVCYGVLQRFRNNVAFHSRASVGAHIEARRALRDDDTFLDLESARYDLRLMDELIAQELRAIPELLKTLEKLGVCRHPAFAKVVSATAASAKLD